MPEAGTGPEPAHRLHLSASSTQADSRVKEWLSHAWQAPGCTQGRSTCLKTESDAPHAGRYGQGSGEGSGTPRRTGSPRDSGLHLQNQGEASGHLGTLCTHDPSLPPSDLAPSRLTHHALDLRSHGKLRTPRPSLTPVQVTQGLLYTDRWPPPTPIF